MASAVAAISCTKLGGRSGIPTYEQTFTFMREQAASTRVGERRRHPSPKVAAKPQRAERAAVATRPTRPASDAAASFASRIVIVAVYVFS